MADAQPARVLCFGPFEADLRNRLLLQNGAPVSLQGQPFDVLALLLEHPGELVTRDQLRARLWPSGTVVEFDHSIHAAVTKVREVLGEQAEHPRYIATVPRHGYRFIAPVKALVTREEFDTAPPPPGRLAGSDAEADKVRTPPSPHGLISRRQARWITGLLVTAAVLGAASFFPARIRPNTPRINSLAVLPLENLSGDSGQEYFSDGVTEAIITDLGKIRSVRVISRKSVMQLKGAEKTLPQIARDLDVDALVEGGVVRSGSRVRITAQLIAMNPERHVWAASYERDATDIIGLQREVAETVAREIRATLSATPSHSPSLNAVNPQAYELYLRGRERLNDFNTRAFFQAIEYLNQVVTLEPDYAPAHASLAEAYTHLGFLSAIPREKASQEAKQAAARALALDDGLAEAHTATAYAKFLFDWDWRGPDVEFRRSIELNPSSADAHLLYSIYLTLSGRFEDAIRENQLAIQLDPLNPFVNFNLGWIYFNSKRYARGISFMQELQRRYPDYPFAHHHLAGLYAGEGKCAEAIAEADHDQSLDEAFTYATCGQSERALKLVHEAETEVARGQLDPIYPAWMYASLGRRDEAIRWLNRAIDKRSIQTVFIKVMPELDSIRSDPRFAAALDRVGAIDPKHSSTNPAAKDSSDADRAR
jgi:TolB-like protein/DNA-binding winged helix-turn-helix (wHTH) protein/Tfp pilus assembly protein PilF